MSETSPQQRVPVSEGALELSVARLTLTIDPPRPSPRADHLRAAIAAVRPDLDLLHQHGETGLIYRAPRVIYRVARGVPTVTAVGEGVEPVMSLNLVGRTMRMGATERRVLDMTLTAASDRLGESEGERTYRFLRPWLALNQQNYDRFRSLKPEDRTAFLNCMIVNNCLSLARSFGVRVSQRLKATTRLRPVEVTHKRVPMLGFLGTFCVNFNIPDGLGLGKTVSKGFGGVEFIGET